MITLPVKQGTTEWMLARLGIPTASQFHRIITPKTLKPSSQAEQYRRELLAEWALGQPMDQAASQWMERGTELEPEARRFYALKEDVDVAEVGFCMTDDRRVGASPDGIIHSAKRGLEIKCRSAPNHVGILLGDDIASATQVQGSMWVTDFEEWDVLAYNPVLPPRIVRVECDPAMMEALDEHIPAFLAKLEAAKRDLVAAGVRPADPATLDDDIRIAEENGHMSSMDAHELRQTLRQGFALFVRQRLTELMREAA